MRRNRWGRIVVSFALLAVMAGLSGCGWRGVNSLPLPGTQGNGPNSFVIRAQMGDVNNIQPNARVRVADVLVGHVTQIELQGWHALVTMRLDGDVNLPANATVKIGQTTLLGTQHIELAPPKSEPPQGKLVNGSLIPLSRAGAFPTPEQTLAAVSMVLNGGGVGQVGDIVEALSTAFRGREKDLRSLVGQLDKFAANLNDQTGDIIAASDSLNDLTAKFAAQRPVLDKALKTIPDALAVLNDERGTLVEAADQLGKFSALTADTVYKSKDNLVKELKEVGPVLESLANAGPSLTRALHFLPTIPFPTDTIEKWQRGDYANLTAIIDLTLSRLDAGLFTGTRYECNLTALELQWGRTVGQYPSPCLNPGRFGQANPISIPYNGDQGP
ncbi:mammalian cell entry protein [Mycobacterium vulneris]|uniref:Mammalian cell entry protein n=2 Tax=Mycolicibacterium vulneris TaxID=547163 RepID=A0A1X2LC88_9MYCO|nr:virulence factor Mce family protein [Mycolicibacterium vulneris]OSC31567.1 mammalian cell entry protein [Mycolicibacterium vulneris]